ncbi:MAG: hypothetical protein KUG83_00590 [Gammaproteobacteria bacterium]|nr:hypothetical protein [Gammaproteobacteria bacterium]
MRNNKSDESLGVFPKKQQMVSFLAVTMMLISGTALSDIVVYKVYFKASPGAMIITGWLMVVIFSLLNFKVTRGSFLCARILRFYALALAMICLPGLFLAETMVERIICYSGVVVLFGAFYLIGGKTYQEMVQNRYDFCAEMMALRAAIEKEMERSASQGKAPKKR